MKYIESITIAGNTYNREAEYKNDTVAKESALILIDTCEEIEEFVVKNDNETIFEFPLKLWLV